LNYNFFIFIGIVLELLDLGASINKKVLLVFDDILFVNQLNIDGLFKPVATLYKNSMEEL